MAPKLQRIIVATMLVATLATLRPRSPDDTFDAARRSGGLPNSKFAPRAGAPYGSRRETLLSPIGVPRTAPPSCKRVAIDLSPTVHPVSKRPLGTTAKGPLVVRLGVRFVAGPLPTARGVLS